MDRPDGVDAYRARHWIRSAKNSCLSQARVSSVAWTKRSSISWQSSAPVRRVWQFRIFQSQQLMKSGPGFRSSAQGLGCCCRAASVIATDADLWGHGRSGDIIASGR
jgi:hypothetical protein